MMCSLSSIANPTITTAPKSTSRDRSERLVLAVKYPITQKISKWPAECQRPVVCSACLTDAGSKDSRIMLGMAKAARIL